jgi:hypothetical protein
MSTQSELHNQIVGNIVRSIVKPPIEAGGSFKDVLVVLESVVAGVLLAGIKLGGDKPVLEVFMKNVADRLADLRTGRARPAP